MRVNYSGLLASYLRVDKYVLALLVCSLALNVYLGAEVRRSRGPALADRPIVGKEAGVIHAWSTEGRPTNLAINEGSRPALVYIFSPTCGWCEKNYSNVVSLSKSVAGEYNVFWVTTDTFQHASDYSHTKHCPFPVYGSVDDGTIRRLGLGATPETIVVTRENKVSHDWKGAWTASKRDEIEAFFHAKLPDSL
jgi:hypothetical protein